MRRSEGRNLTQLNKNKTGARRKRAQGGLKPFQKHLHKAEESGGIVLVQQFLPFRSHPAPELGQNPSRPNSLVPFQNCRKRCRQPSVGSSKPQADQHLASQRESFPCAVWKRPAIGYEKDIFSILPPYWKRGVQQGGDKNLGLPYLHDPELDFFLIWGLTFGEGCCCYY